MNEPLEIERKWLIEYPSVDMMKNMTDYDYSEIEQTYTNYMEHSVGTLSIIWYKKSKKEGDIYIANRCEVTSQNHKVKDN